MKRRICFTLSCILGLPIVTGAQTAKPAWQTDWDKTIELAKKEGRVVVSLTTSAELRAAIENSLRNASVSTSSRWSVARPA